MFTLQRPQFPLTLTGLNWLIDHLEQNGSVSQCRWSETVRKFAQTLNNKQNHRVHCACDTMSIALAFPLNSFGREKHLRQHQGVLRSVVVVQGGLLGVHLIVDDGQLAQALDKCVRFWREDCGQEGQINIIVVNSPQELKRAMTL